MLMVLAPTKKKAEAMAEAREARGRREREAAEASGESLPPAEALEAPTDELTPEA
jgi:hypothetical protein